MFRRLPRLVSGVVESDPLDLIVEYSVLVLVMLKDTFDFVLLFHLEFNVFRDDNGALVRVLLAAPPL
jgi:hypothetical protein